MIQFNNRSHLNTKKVKRKASMSKEAAQYMLDQDVVKDSNDYIPADTWNLRNSSLLHTRFGSGRVIWKTPYARRLYYNPQYNFSKDKNPKAGGLWFERAKALKRPSWMKTVGRKYAKYFNGK